jgi:CHAT domain-containing protein/Tfp pilus assembly protein PilF
MSHTIRLGGWSLALILSLGSYILAMPRPALSVSVAQISADEAALRALAETFYRAWAAKDGEGYWLTWSVNSPELEARRKATQALFASGDRIELRALTIRAVKTDGDKAQLRVEAEVHVTEAKTGKEKAGYGKMHRTLGCAKEAGHWKVWREGSATDELAAALAMVNGGEERAALLAKVLAEEKELVTAELVQALIVQGNRFLNQGSSSQALVLYRLAQSIGEQIGDQVGISNALNNEGLALYRQGNSAQALEYLQKSLVLREALGNQEGIAGTLNNIGEVQRSQGNYAQALEYFQKSLAMREALGNKAGIAMMLNNIGIIHDSQGSHAQAVEYFRKSLTMSEALGDKAGIERSLNNLGLAQHHQGNYAQALEHYQKSLAIGEASGNKAGISAKLVNIGLVYRLQGNYAQALEYYQKGLTLSEALGDKGVIAKLLNNIGSVYYQQGSFAQALECYRKSLAVKEALGDKAGIASSLYNVGLVHNQQGDHVRALEYFQKSLVMNEALGKKSGIAGALKSIATVHRSQGNYAQALEFAERAATLARTIGENEMLWDSLVIAGRSYRQLNKPVEARQALEEAITIIEMLRAQVAGGEEEQQRFFASKVSPYHAMVDLLIAEGKKAEALTFAERAKARVLLDVLQTGRVNVTKALTGGEQERDRKLRAELISINTQVTRANQKDNPDQARLDVLKSLREKARLDYEAFQTSLYAAHPELRVQRGEAPVINAGELAALLPDHKSALLEYVITDDATYLFAVSKADGKPVAEVQVFRLPLKPAELAKQTESLWQQLAGRDLGFRTSAKQLYQLLLRPAQAQFQGKTNLVIVPDGKLWELPFQALVAENGRYVIESSAVSYAPSLTVLREMRAQRGRRQDSAVVPTLLALGNPALGQEAIERATRSLRDGKLDPLPEAEAEVKALGQLYGAARSKVYVGAEAREDRAKAEAARAGILHFATHGILNDASPMYSHLVLAPGDQNGIGPREDGLLEAWELTQLDLKADLAVLSACETARGRFGAGEGVIGLTWALFVAGVPATVVSQWKVESAGTRELMVDFHQSMRARSTKADALRQAALKLMKKADTNHPFYWAGFVLIGDGQ